MSKSLKLIFFFLVISSNPLHSTPSSLFLTNATTEVQPYGTLNIALIDYFTVFNRRGHGSSLPTDFGLTLGCLQWKDLKGEIGIDYLGGQDDPLYFNTKLGISEDKLFNHAPSASIGIFDVGTRRKGRFPTNYNVIHGEIGHSLPKAFQGRIYFGGYTGSHAIGPVQSGFWGGVDFDFLKRKDCNGNEHPLFQLTADYASGKNIIGGGGASISWYFNANMYIQTGFALFNYAKLNGTWKWTIQAYFNIPVWKKNDDG